MPSKVGTPDTLAWARYYSDLGLHPIPVRPRTKIPMVPWREFQANAPTAAEIEGWFSSGNKSIALILGRGIIAVDMDGPGAEQLLVDAGVDLPDSAPRSRTRNGYHVFLHVGEALGDRVGMLKSQPDEPKSQVDIRGVGIVVAPPSVHESGHVYEWERRIGRDVPDAPEALIALIKRTGGAVNGSKRAVGAPEALPAASDAPKWVAEALRGVGEGKRDHTCARLAGYFLGKGVPADIVKAQLYTFGDRCTPPFSKKEVDKTVESVNRKDVAAHTPAPGPFQILGYNNGTYYYLPKGSRQIVELRADQHSKLNLMRLAPMQYWQANYTDRKGVEWDMVANALIQLAERAGVYDSSRIRGRGAWWDGADAVLHVGDALITAGTRINLADIPSGRFIYEASSPMGIDVESPLDVDAANLVVKMAELVSWERPISARLLAGWCAIAPVCGAVGWRPHIWLTGPAGTGKTWMIDKVVRRLMGEMGLAVQSETTEAGLRQTLGHDARPVIFDEIEGEDQRAQMRVQNVLALARQASSETGAVIIKGSPLGGARTYRIRSAFAFSSIGVGVDKYADSTRVSVLSIERRHDPERFRKLEALVVDTITDEYVRRFIARSVRLVPQIRANAITFARAGADVIGSQRLGDQIGALLAGCYSLFADDAIGIDEAHEWLEAQDWSEQKNVQDETDESMCLRRILEHLVRVQTPKGLAERSIAELIRVARAGGGDILSPDEASAALGRIGIRVDRESFTVSSSHAEMGTLLAGTQWAKAWSRTLRRIPGAVATDLPVRFGATRGRGVQIPIEAI